MSTVSATTRWCRRPRPRCRRVLRAPSRCSRGKLWREQLREWDDTCKPAAIAHAPGTAGGRSGQPVRCRTGGLPDALPRPPRGHDRAAHALHRRRPAADRRLPGPGGRLDRPGACRTAGPAARLGRGVGRRLRRDGRAEDGVCRGLAGARGAGLRRRPGRRAGRRAATRPRCWRGCAPCPAWPGRRSTATSTWSATASSTASTSPSRRRSKCPMSLLRAINVAVFGDEQGESDVSARTAAVREQVPAAAPGRPSTSCWPKPA